MPVRFPPQGQNVSITSKSQLPSQTVFDDEANTYGDFDQIFRSSRVKIRNPADTFGVTLVNSAIIADRNLTIPLLTANDEILISGVANQFITGAKIFSVGSATFRDNMARFSNPAATQDYHIRGSAITAQRDITFPLLTANDIFVMEAFAQTLTNKTLGTTTIQDAADIILNTTTGTKIGTATTQKLGFFNKAPVTQRGAIAAPTGGAVADAEARTAINSIRQVLIDLGFTA